MTRREHAAPHALPPVAAYVDSQMVEICTAFDWLRLVTPRRTEMLWKAFRDSRYAEMPSFTYPNVDFDLAAARKRLLDLPVREIEFAVYKALLTEKQRELDRQLELIELRGSDGFRQVGIDLFGVADAELYADARHILETVAATDPGNGGFVDADYVAKAAQRQLAYYKSQCPDFSAVIIRSEDIIAGLMVSEGDLLISNRAHIPRNRLDALLHHEIGTHILTCYNGSHQPLQQLRSGLAHYDELQEGLGVLSEYLAGNLSSLRLRTLAARVVAVRMMTDEATFRDVFETLRTGHGFSARSAFTITLRVFRGGGLTKDVVYLRGLRDLLAYLREGHPFEPLFVGKFSLSQLAAIRMLRKSGRLNPPRLLPSYMHNASAQQRLSDCGELPLDKLYQRLVA